MGWKWEDDDEESSNSIYSPKGLGSDVLNPNPSPRDSMEQEEEEEERCSTRRIVKSSCRTEEVEPGRFIRKCDKTEKILRDCVGRPVEIVESKTEHTEDDVTDEVTNGRLAFRSSGVEPFSFPGLRSDIKSIERGLSGGLGQFIEVAEEMANKFFQSFDFPSRRGLESLPFQRWFPHDGRRDSEGNAPKQMDEPTDYSGLPGEVTDV